MTIEKNPAVVPSSFTLQIYEISANCASICQTFFKENKSFCPCSALFSGDKQKRGKAESRHEDVSGGAEAERGLFLVKVLLLFIII